LAVLSNRALLLNNSYFPVEAACAVRASSAATSGLLISLNARAASIALEGFSAQNRSKAYRVAVIAP